MFTVKYISNGFTERLNIYIGYITHEDNLTIDSVYVEPELVISPEAQLRDMFT